MEQRNRTRRTVMDTRTWIALVSACVALAGCFDEDAVEAEAEALVNTVNTEGVMGKGIALQFKQAYPAMFKAYEKACAAGEVRLGKVHVFDLGGLVGGPRWIINFPTKGHWR